MTDILGKKFLLQRQCVNELVKRYEVLWLSFFSHRLFRSHLPLLTLLWNFFCCRLLEILRRTKYRIIMRLRTKICGHFSIILTLTFWFTLLVTKLIFSAQGQSTTSYFQIATTILPFIFLCVIFLFDYSVTIILPCSSLLYFFYSINPALSFSLNFFYSCFNTFIPLFYSGAFFNLLNLICIFFFVNSCVVKYLLF